MRQTLKTILRVLLSPFACQDPSRQEPQVNPDINEPEKPKAVDVSRCDSGSNFSVELTAADQSQRRSIFTESEGFTAVDESRRASISSDSDEITVVDEPQRDLNATEPSRLHVRDERWYKPAPVSEPLPDYRPRPLTPDPRDTRLSPVIATQASSVFIQKLPFKIRRIIYEEVLGGRYIHLMRIGIRRREQGRDRPGYVRCSGPCRVLPASIWRLVVPERPDCLGQHVR